MNNIRKPLFRKLYKILSIVLCLSFTLILEKAHAQDREWRQPENIINNQYRQSYISFALQNNKITIYRNFKKSKGTVVLFTTKGESEIGFGSWVPVRSLGDSNVNAPTNSKEYSLEGRSGPGYLAAKLQSTHDVYIFPVEKSYPVNKVDYESERIKQYVRYKKKLAKWPGIHPQYHLLNEIFPRSVKKIPQKSTESTNKLEASVNKPAENKTTADSKIKKRTNSPMIAVLSGVNCTMAMVQTFSKYEFDKYVFLSPGPDFNNLLVEIPRGAEILWMGTQREKFRLLQFQKKFGGKVITYENAGSAYTIFKRNFNALPDITKWLLGD